MNDKRTNRWVDCKLGDVVEIKSGYAFPSKEFRDSGVPLIRQGNLAGDKVSLEKCVYLDPTWLNKKQDFIIHKSDVLIGMSGSVGKLCLYDIDTPALQNQRTGKVVLRFPELVSWRYIWEYLKTVESQLLKKGKGLGVLNVSAADIKSLSFLLPPIDEQRRIVAKLEKLLNKVEECQQRLDKIPVILKHFRQSVLAAACSGHLTADWRDDDSYTEDLPTSWRRVPLVELMPPKGIFDGPFGSNLKTSDYTDSGVRVIRLENVGHLRFISEKETWVSREKYKTLKKHTVGENDIIFASFIDEEIRACLLPKLETIAIAKADCFCLRPTLELVDRQYLTYQLVSNESYIQILEYVHGATRPRINTTQIRNLKVRLCPLPEQREIVRRVEAFFKIADQIEERYNKAKAQVDKLTQSILAKAFRGELVPQDPNDEPASELLSRIKVERGKRENAMRKNQSNKRENY